MDKNQLLERIKEDFTKELLLAVVLESASKLYTDKGVKDPKEFATTIGIATAGSLADHIATDLSNFGVLNLIGGNTLSEKYLSTLISNTIGFGVATGVSYAFGEKFTNKELASKYGKRMLMSSIVFTISNYEEIRQVVVKKYPSLRKYLPAPKN